MAYVMSAFIRLVDEASPVLNNIGNTGTRTIAGLEEGFIKVDSAMSRVTKGITEASDFLSAFAGDISDAALQSENFSNAVFDESEELRKNAQSLQLKADSAERAAESERRHYEEIQNKIAAEGNASDLLKESAAAVLQKAESLEKSAECWRKEADAAEQAYLALDNNAQAVAQTVQAEEKLIDSLNKTVQTENESAGAFGNTAAAMDNTAKTASATATSLNKLDTDTTGTVSAARTLAIALSDEAEKLRLAAVNARKNADEKRAVAQSAKELHNELKSKLLSMQEDTNATKEDTKALAEQTEQARRLAKSQEEIANRAEKRAQNLEKELAAARKNASAMEDAAKADEQLYNAANKTAAAEKKVADSLNKSEREAREYGEAVNDAAQKSEQLGYSGRNAGELLQDAFTTLGVAAAINKITDAFGACINESIEFESAITGVYKTVDGTDEQLSQISDEIKTMSLEIPSTTTEIAGVAEAAGQLSIATDDITDFTKVMINLGEATNLSSDEAASFLAKFANITGMSAENYENLGSSIVALGNNFATTEADIVAMATRMASAGTLAGLAETDILGLAAAMSSVGIEADAGGSAMSTLLSDIQVAVETASEDLDDFASVANMTSEEFRSAFEENAVSALYAFIDGLNDVERNGETATVILENMGITEIRLSNAVKSLASNSDGLADALNVSSQAWEENTALADEANTRYGTLESRLAIAKNAASNLKIAIGDDLTPVIGEFADMGTNALTWITGLIEEHPAVTAAITAISAALGIGAVAITGYTVATNVAIPATKKFTTALNANPIIRGITIAAGITGAIITFTKVISANRETVEDYNGTLEQCHTEIERTEAAYRNVCNMYGSQSQAAQALAADLETLNAQYKKGGGFVADYEQRLAESKEALDSFTLEYTGKMGEIDKDWQNGLVATAQLEALSQKAALTNADLDMMTKYADYLNNDFNCDIKVDYDTGELTGFDPTDITQNLFETAMENRAQTAADSLTDGEFIDGYLNQAQSLADAKDDLYVLYMKLDKFNDPEFTNPDNWDFSELYDDYKKLSDEVENGNAVLDDYESAIRELFVAMGNPEGADDFIQQLNNTAFSFDEIKNSAEEANEVMTPEEAVSEAWQAQQEAINQLAQDYGEAYISIRADIEGMFGLFEEASMNLENTLSLDGAIANLESQIDYFNQYEEALNQLSEIGIDNSILEQLDPEQAVAFAQELGNMDASAAAEKVEELNKSFEGLSGAKDEVSKQMVAVNDELNQRFDKIQDDMEKAIDNMGLEKEAAASAKSTIDGYITGLKSNGNRAVSEAYDIAGRISKALSSVTVSTPNINVSSGSPSVTSAPASGSSKTTATTVKTNAAGTTYSDDIYIAGEDGPELILGKKGSTVFPADETNRIIEAVTENRPFYIPPAESPVKRIEKRDEAVSRREISIDINGKGAVNINSGINKEQVLEIMWENFKPVLMGILSEDIFEEGDGSYDF